MPRLLILLLAASLTSCAEEPAPPPISGSAQPSIPFRQDGTLAFVRAGGDTIQTIAIEIAETDSALARGLMQRASLPERSGMLFLFPREEPQSFWMANTPLALDILYANTDSQIVRIAKYTRPFSPENIPSGAPARYVVEVPAGYTDRHGITEGDGIRWRRDG